jgi:hypothetical protein
MSARSKAWVLMPRGLPPVAVADHEVIEYLTIAEPRPVPVTPAHAGAVIFWRDRIVPLMDFTAVDGQASLVTGKTVVLGYQLEPGTPLNYVAIALREAPTRLVVDDETVCGLPEIYAELWDRLAKACFSRDDVATPIVSIATLCSAEFRNFLNDYAIEPWLPEDNAVNGLMTAAQGLDSSGVPTITANQDTAQIIDFGQPKTKSLEDADFADEDLDDDWSDMSDEDEDEDGADSWLDEDFDDDDDDDEDLDFAADDDAWDDDFDDGEDEDDGDDSWNDDLEDDSDSDWDDEKEFAPVEDDEDSKALLDEEDDLGDFDDDFDSDDDFDDDDEKDSAAARSSKRVQAV